LLVGLVGWLSKLAARPTPPKERGKKKECTLIVEERRAFQLGGGQEEYMQVGTHLDGCTTHS
jgi:hypothetical protein